jgi:diguanylate cyclase (GGDEF)-like protein
MEQPVRLLVADDEPDTRAALALALGPGYEILTAGDGAEALAVARSGHPDVILLDVMMPSLDGFQVLEQLRADPTTAEIPVLLVSARRDDVGKVLGLGLGAVDYLEKPFSAPELRARVERTVRLLRSQRALRQEARTDTLTGLANVRAFRAQLEIESRRAHRYHEHLTCIMVDLDDLKAINDQLGHPAGDGAIASIAALLREELRETDFGARYGGDEFVLLLPHTGAEDGRRFAERVCARVKVAVCTAGGQRVPLQASFGVASQGPADHQDAAALLQAADDALYRAKASGGGRVELAGASRAPDQGRRARRRGR